MSGRNIQELGGILIAEGLISPGQLEDALSEQVRTQERLGEILCRRAQITGDDLIDALARQLGHRRLDLSRDAVEPAAIDLVPHKFAQRHNLLPIRVTEEMLTVALTDPLDVEALDHLDRIAGRNNRTVEILLASPETLEKARSSSYGRIEGSRIVRKLMDEATDEVTAALVPESEDEEDVQRRAQDAKVIAFVDQIISQALEERATDIHVEPLEKGLLIRYRVDGLLYDALSPSRAIYMGTVSRIKILADMDIAERRAPQDGRFTHRGNRREVDIRVSSIPTIHGEKVVLRLLDKTSFNFGLRDLGFSENHYRDLVKAIHQPYGMILLSGPTGSGKSTTLYASLLELRNETLNITTVEDPVEYQMARINQVQVNTRKRVTFAEALRYFLRQDPDVIMVGEMRDRDTSEIAVRAALTGHMVFSTIHANDAPTTATRLISMGVEPFMGASALTLVAAQRLVRRNCIHCLRPYEPGEDVLMALGMPPDEASRPQGGRFQKGAGCAACRGRGYTGRVAIVEMLPMSSHLRQLVAENRPAGEIRELAISEGMKTLRQSGFEKALAGTTTLEEVLRVCLSDE